MPRTLGLLLLCLVLAWPFGARAMQIEAIAGASGVKAWLVEDHSVPVVTLRFAFPGGAALDPPGKGGLASLASDLLDEGAGEYDTTAFHADYLDRRAGLIEAVTADRVRALARRLLDPNRLSFVVVGEPGGITATRPPRPMQLWRLDRPCAVPPCRPDPRQRRDRKQPGRRDDRAGPLRMAAHAR